MSSDMAQVKDRMLVCKNVKFNSVKDKEIFFEWLEKIDCIDEVLIEGKNIYLDICADEISDDDLNELIAIFYRYKVDMTQLKRFLTNDNKKWFYKDKGAFWHRRVFGNPAIIKNEVVLICTPLNFYTQDDKDMFFEWIDRIHSIRKIKELKKELRLSVEAADLSERDLLNFIGIFKRYNFDVEQLKVFMNKDNKKFF